jgi:hypothetical protein
LALFLFLSFIILSCEPEAVKDQQVETIELGSVWYRQTQVDVGNGIKIFSPACGLFSSFFNYDSKQIFLKPKIC